MRTAALATLIVAALATSGMTAEKQRKPRLDLRAAPRMAFSPVNVLLTAELMGGDDVEEYYCPALVWDWDDGGRSEHEQRCDYTPAAPASTQARHPSSDERKPACLCRVSSSPVADLLTSWRAPALAPFAPPAWV